MTIFDGLVHGRRPVNGAPYGGAWTIGPGIPELTSAAGATPPSAPAADVLPLPDSVVPLPNSVAFVPWPQEPADASNLYVELPCGHLKPYPWQAQPETSDSDDTNAPEGHAAAAALAPETSERIIRDAGELVEYAEAALRRSLAKLMCVGPEDTERVTTVNLLLTSMQRAQHELSVAISRFRQVGVRP